MKHEAPWVFTEGEFWALTRLEALSLEQASEFLEGLIRMQTAGSSTKRLIPQVWGGPEKV